VVARRGVMLALPQSDEATWKKQPNEPTLWFRRFDHFRLMEDRTIPAAYRELTHDDENNTPGNWYKYAKKWQWENRAAAWDAHLDAEWEKQLKKERTRILRARYALQHKRIEALDDLAQKLIDYLEDEDNIWLPDVKGIGTGPTAERVDLIRFNAPLISEIRATLADIAAERGERVKKVDGDMTLTILPKEYWGISPDDEGSEP
jgi:hypothetical protein